MYWMFPMRNRLMAGISRATLMIEAARDSGTLITARLTTEYNRDLLAVPGPITSPMSYGPNFFLKEGAVPITEPADLLRALGFKSEMTAEQTATQKQTIQNCTAEEKQILELLIEPTERDELARKLSRPIYEVNMTLTLMELKGLIKEEYGQIRRT
jgi:DNA processing protein